jgi:uncharacterized protein YdhG (YjbR/CyaY superfamily)
MKIEAADVDAYYASVPEDRKPAMNKLRGIFKKQLPKGFEECLWYGMPSFVIPLKTYPKGYHVKPGIPLGMVSIASQKNFIAVYHTGLYFNEALTKWFNAEYPKHSKTKLDMGKGCIRFKKHDAIPFELLIELAKKISPQDYIAAYEKALKR